MTAIVTDVHYRMSLALIRDLADRGVSVVACEYEDVKNPAGFFSRAAGSCRTICRDGSGESLLALCRDVYERDGEKPALFPVGAATLSAVSRRKADFCRICGLLAPDFDTLELFNDKARVGVLARSLGIPVPQTYSVGESFEFPVVVKPVCGEKAGLSAPQRYVIAVNRDELLTAYEHFEKITGTVPVIQEYLSGGGAGCSVLAKKGMVLAHICHRRVREYPVSGGPSSCCEKIDAPQLLEAAKKLVEAQRFSGVAMFEFKADGNGRYRLLEINPRVWGTYPLTRVCGSNFGYMWYCFAAGIPLPQFDQGKKVKMAYYPSDFAAMLGYLKRGNIGAFFGGLADALNPCVKNGIGERGDGRPYRVYLKSLLERGGK